MSDKRVYHARESFLAELQLRVQFSSRVTGLQGFIIAEDADLVGLSEAALRKSLASATP